MNNHNLGCEPSDSRSNLCAAAAGSDLLPPKQHRDCRVPSKVQD
jgi:hypothetical protein